MAIDRIKGRVLDSDLDRQGKDLQFTTNGSPLLYLDFANFRAAFNTDTALATETLTVNGNVRIASIKIDTSTISSDVDLTLAPLGALLLGDVSKVKINGGVATQILSTDGVGNLTWVSAGAGGATITGQEVLLGAPTDTSLVAFSAYKYWTANTTLTDAADNLNQVILNIFQQTYVGAADFTADVVSGSTPLTVQFTSSVLGQPNAYFWDFGDGTTSTLANPTHTYANSAGGANTVYFKAYNTNGTKAGAGRAGDPMLAQGSYADVEKENFITLYTAVPTATFTLDKTSIDNTGAVQLSNTSQYADSYVINWGDGQTTTVASNVAAGGPGQAAVAHTYTNTGGDTAYYVTMEAYSASAGVSGQTITSAPTKVSVFSTHITSFTATPMTGRNQHNITPNGLTVTFTNTTSSSPGPVAQFPGNLYRWNFGDGTIVDIPVGALTPIAHTYTLNDPEDEDYFDVTLSVINGHTASPFVSTVAQISLTIVPTAQFTGTAIAVSDRTGDTTRTGYVFTDYNGVNRATFDFTNTSINADSYRWTYGDSFVSPDLAEGDDGTPTGNAISHTYLSNGVYNVSLRSTGPESIDANDDTMMKASYITILPVPAAPQSVGATTLTIASVGTTPGLAASAENNSTASMPAAGSAVRRVTVASPISTDLISNIYDASTGTMRAVINGVNDVPATMNIADNTGTFGALMITADQDAHAIAPATYPSEFYKVFNGKVSVTNASVSKGYNTMQITHSTAGNTNVLGYVKDTNTAVPTLSLTAATAAMTTPGALKYISGIPYFTTGGVITVSGVTVSNWIDQTYLLSTTPFAVTATDIVSGSGALIATQQKTYTDLDNTPTMLQAGIPFAGTGFVSSYNIAPITVAINGSAIVTGKIGFTISNVNGSSIIAKLPTSINLYNGAVAGFNELIIPVSDALGIGYTDDGLRTSIAGAVGGTPTFSAATNYYTTPFTGAVNVATTDEAVVSQGVLTNDVTNYSTYLPPGPNLSGRSGTQYFRFAFRRSVVSNFTITYSGKISGMWIAAPGTQIDTASSTNGWADAAITYAGVGVPGANTAQGGNGSNGCAKTSGDRVPVGQLVSSRSVTLSLGSESSSNATGNVILVCLAIAPGDTLTGVSVS